MTYLGEKVCFVKSESLVKEAEPHGSIYKNINSTLVFFDRRIIYQDVLTIFNIYYNI